MKRSGSTIGRTSEPAVQQPAPGQMLQHRRAEAADRALLDRDQHLVVPRQLLDQRRVERLGEARVGDRRRQAARRQLVRRPQRIGKPRAERQDRDRAALAQHPARARAAAPRPRRRQRRRPCPRRADSAARSAGRRSPPPSPPCARAPPRPTAPSARSPAGSRDRRGRSCPRASPRPRPPAPPGPSRSAPAGAGSPRRAPPGRRRAAGTSNRSRRTAAGPRSPCPAANVTACCSAMPTSKHAVREALGEAVEPGAGRHRRRDRDDPFVAPRPRRSARRRTPACRTAGRAAPSPARR